MVKKHKRTALIGLDGMSWRVLLNFRKVFKNIFSLTVNGIRGINWCIPPFTPPSWISISTGVKPKKHGILGTGIPQFRSPNSYEYKFFSSHDVKVPRISEMLALKSLRSVVINPDYFSHPISAWYTKNQVLVSFVWMTPKEYIYPKTFERYLKYFKFPKFKPSRRHDKWVINLTQSVLDNTEGTLKLIEEYDPDFLWIVFIWPDTIMHYLPSVIIGTYYKHILELFSAIDEFVGEIRHRFDYILIVSDHGFDIYVRRINLLGLFAKYGVITSPSITIKIKSKLPSTSLYGMVKWSLMKLSQELTIFHNFRKGISKMILQHLLSRSKSVDKKRERKSFNGLVFDEIDKDDAFIVYFYDKKTRMYAFKVLEKHAGDLFENVTSLDINGVAALLIVPRKGYHFANIPELRGSEILKNVSYSHSPSGIFILNGPGIESSIRNIKNFDIAPTILSIFELPLAKHFDGQSIIKNQIGVEDYLKKWKLLRRTRILNPR